MTKDVVGTILGYSLEEVLAKTITGDAIFAQGNCAIHNKTKKYGCYVCNKITLYLGK